MDARALREISSRKTRESAMKLDYGIIIDARVLREVGMRGT